MEGGKSWAGELDNHNDTLSCQDVPRITRQGAGWERMPSPRLRVPADPPGWAREHSIMVAQDSSSDQHQTGGGRGGR